MSHFSKLEVGDVSTGQWSSVVQATRLKFTALNAGQRLYLPDGGHITELRVMDAAGALVVGTVAIGTAEHGTQVFTGASTAGAALKVEKPAPAGAVWVEVTAGTVPLTVLLTVIPG